MIRAVVGVAIRLVGVPGDVGFVVAGFGLQVAWYAMVCFTLGVKNSKWWVRECLGMPGMPGTTSSGHALSSNPLE
jgi:hypothetical protein